MINDPVLIALFRQAKCERQDGLDAAYPREQGAGLMIVLDALPLTNRIILLGTDRASR
jgi:hypothetical protein